MANLPTPKRPAKQSSGLFGQKLVLIKKWLDEEL